MQKETNKNSGEAVLLAADALVASGFDATSRQQFVTAYHDFCCGMHSYDMASFQKTRVHQRLSTHEHLGRLAGILLHASAPRLAKEENDDSKTPFHPFNVALWTCWLIHGAAEEDTHSPTFTRMMAQFVDEGGIEATAKLIIWPPRDQLESQTELDRVASSSSTTNNKPYFTWTTLWPDTFMMLLAQLMRSRAFQKPFFHKLDATKLVGAASTIQLTPSDLVNLQCVVQHCYRRGKSNPPSTSSSSFHTPTLLDRLLHFAVSELIGASNFMCQEACGLLVQNLSVPWSRSDNKGVMAVSRKLRQRALSTYGGHLVHALIYDTCPPKELRLVQSAGQQANKWRFADLSAQSLSTICNLFALASKEDDNDGDGDGDGDDAWNLALPLAFDALVTFAQHPRVVCIACDCIARLCSRSSNVRAVLAQEFKLLLPLGLLGLEPGPLDLLMAAHQHASAPVVDMARLAIVALHSADLFPSGIKVHLSGGMVALVVQPELDAFHKVLALKLGWSSLSKTTTCSRVNLSVATRAELKLPDNKVVGSTASTSFLSNYKAAVPQSCSRPGCLNVEAGGAKFQVCSRCQLARCVDN